MVHVGARQCSAAVGGHEKGKITGRGVWVRLDSTRLDLVRLASPRLGSGFSRIRYDDISDPAALGAPRLLSLARLSSLT